MKRELTYKAWIVLGALALSGLCARAELMPQDHWVSEDSMLWHTGAWGIAADTQHVFVSSASSIKVFENRTLTNEWSCSGTMLRGIALDDEHLYACELDDDCIHVYTKDGTVVTNWGINGTGTGQFVNPYDVAVDAEHVYVADSGNHRVQVFTKTGVFVRMWGSYGSVPERFHSPQGIAVDAANVYVADTYNERIQVFTKDGTYVRHWDIAIANYEYQTPENRRPYGIAIDGNTVLTVHGEDYPSGSHKYAGRLRVADKLGNILWEKITYQGHERHFYEPLSYPRCVAVASPWIYVAESAMQLVLPVQRYFRTLGTRVANGMSMGEVAGISQRPGTSVLDIDYVVNDLDDTNATVYTAAFVVSTNTGLHLADIIPMRSFLEGTDGNIGSNIAVGATHRLTWDMEADNVGESVGDYGNLTFCVMAKDDRPLLDLHMLELPPVGTNAAFKINQAPLYDEDFLPMWFWFLSAGDPGIDLQTGKIFGVGGDYDGDLLANGTTTTADGRAFLLGKMGLREATAHELQVAREASTPGAVAKWDPQRTPPSSGYKVNEFSFVTDPTNGWWVVDPSYP